LIPLLARRWLGAFTFLVCLCSVAPVAVIVIESFTSANYVAFPPPGLSVKWYVETFKRPEFVDSMIISLVIALGTSIVSTALGTLTSIALVRHSFRGRKLLQSLFSMPLSLPGLIFGLALLQFITMRSLPVNGYVILVAHIIITMPFAIRFVSVALLGVGANVELAARSLGANPWSTFRYVTLPLIRPGMVASLVFSFILSFDEVAASLFISSPGAMTLPVRIYVYIDQNYDPLITAISSLLVFAAVIALVVIEKTIGMGRLFGLK
jgi:putative spermidine/putrescine transport system permease protein